MNKIRSLLVASTLLMAGGTAHANLITNGDFETGDLTGWTFTADSSAETGLAADVAAFDGSNAFRLNTGTSTVGVEAGGTLSQSVSVTSGTSYTLSADLLAIQNDRNSTNVDGGTITALIDGLALHTFDVGSISSGVTELDAFAASFTAITTGLVDVQFYFSREYLNPAGLNHFLDDVSLVSASVPEPGSLALLALGLAGLTLRGKRNV